MGVVALAIGQPRVDLRAAFRTQLFGLGQRQSVKIDQRDVLLRSQFANRFHIGYQRVPLDLAIGGEHAAHDRRHQHRLRPRGPRLVDVTRHVLAKCGLGVGLAVRALAGPVVVPELDQDVVGLAGHRRRPQPFVAEALRTPAVLGQVDHFHVRAEPRAEARTPAALVVHRGIAHQHDADGRRRLPGSEAR